jgi:hypothetical protein
MQKLGSFLDKKTLSKRLIVDEKSVFYVFEFIIKAEYGRQGFEKIKPILFRDRKLFVRISGGLWEGEISLRKKEILNLLNKELGGDEIVDLIISN